MSADSLEIRTYRSLEELESLRVNWKELLKSYPLATTFSTPEWLISWWRSLGADQQSSDQQLLVAGFFDATSRLVALAPLSLTRVRVAPAISLRLLRLMGDGTHDSDNLDLPVTPGFEDRFAQSLLHYLKSQRSSWDFCELNTMPPQSPVANAFRQLLERKKWIVLENHRPASAIALPATWEEYLLQLSAKERGKIAYYGKRLERKYQTRFYKCETEAELPACLEALFHLHQNRWTTAGQPGSFGSPARRQFYFELGRLLLAQGLLEFWMLDVNGKPAAAQFGFRFGSTVSQLQEGFDRNYSTDSVGYVLRARAIQVLIAQGVRTYDFLGGEPGYKAKWGADPGHYLDLRFARPFSVGAAYLRTQEYAAQGKSWLRRNLPATVWNILHQTNVGIRRRGRKTTSTILPSWTQDDPNTLSTRPTPDAYTSTEDAAETKP
jgi:CelD/BcsL family acetyltransferase involved in cellulose biosynthesis